MNKLKKKKKKKKKVRVHLPCEGTVAHLACDGTMAHLLVMELWHIYFVIIQ